MGLGGHEGSPEGFSPPPGRGEGSEYNYNKRGIKIFLPLSDNEIMVKYLQLTITFSYSVENLIKTVELRVIYLPGRVNTSDR